MARRGTVKRRGAHGKNVERNQTAGQRKRRTREHIIADLSVNHVERAILRAGHTTQRVLQDYGFDLYLTTYDVNR